MLTYGGVNLTLPTPQQVEWLSSTFTLRRLFEFSRVYWPGPRTPWLTFPGQKPDAPLKLGCLNWPRGASRFATFYAIVPDNILAAIRAAGAPASALPLVMKWDDALAGTSPASITTSLWMLPAIPLTQIGGSPGHSLITCIDDRYWWWFRSEGVVTVTEGSTSWDSLYAQLVAALGISFSYDAIDAAYLKPSGLFTTNYEYLPLLLDAVAFNVGQRIVRYLDGTVKGRSVLSGAADVAADLLLPAARSLLAGGAFLPADVLASIPANVVVSFPTSAGVTAPLAVTKPTGGVAVAVKQFHGAALSDGTNTTALTALATRIGLDFGAASLQLGDWKYAGIVPWVPDPLHDAVEWVTTAEGGPLGHGEVSTRVIPAPWNDLTDQYLYTAGAGSSAIDSLTVNNLTVNVEEVINGILVFSVNRVSTNGTYNDWNLQGKTKQAITPTGNTTITGFAGGVDGQLLFVWNVSTSRVTLAYENAGSAAADRIITPLHSDYVIWPDGGEILEYDGISQRWRFDSPTFGAGDTTLRTYGCRRLKFTTGLTYTDNADGSGTVTAQGSLTSGNVVLASNKSVGAGFASVGADFPWTAPATGTYLLTAQVTAHITPHSMGANWISARLKNTTTGNVIGSAAVVVYEQTVDIEDYGTAVLVQSVAITAADQIDLEAGYFGTGTPSTSDVLAAGTGSSAGTVLTWVKIA